MSPKILLNFLLENELKDLLLPFLLPCGITELDPTTRSAYKGRIY